MAWFKDERRAEIERRRKLKEKQKAAELKVKEAQEFKPAPVYMEQGQLVPAAKPQPTTGLREVFKTTTGRPTQITAPVPATTAAPKKVAPTKPKQKGLFASLL